MENKKPIAAHNAHMHKLELNKSFLKMPHTNKRANYDLILSIVTERLIREKLEKDKALTREKITPQMLKDWMPRITESNLRMEMAIDPQSTLYEFPILVNETVKGVPANDQEIRLDLNDLFFITEIGFYIRLELGNTKAERGGFVNNGDFLLTYSPYELAPEWYDALQPLWNGKVKFSQDNIVLQDDKDLYEYNVAPPTQFSSYFDQIAQPPVGNARITIPSLNYKRDGMVELTPMIELSGSKKNAIDVVLFDPISNYLMNFNTYNNPVWSSLGINTSVNLASKNVVCICNGVLVQNFSKFQH